MHIYAWQIDTPQSRIDAFNIATPYLVHLMADQYIYIDQWTYTYVRFSPLLQLSKDLWKTITPNMFHT